MKLSDGASCTVRLGGSGQLASLTSDAVAQGLTGVSALRFVASNLSGAGPQIDRRDLVDADKSHLLTIEQMTAIMSVLGVAPPAPAAATRRQWTADRRSTEYFHSLLDAIRSMAEELNSSSSLFLCCAATSKP